MDLSPERFYTRCVKCNGHGLDSLRQLFSHQSNLLPECVSIGVFSHSGLGPKLTGLSSGGSLGAMAFVSEKVLWRVPPTVLLYTCLLRFSGANGCCFRKGSPNGCLHLSPSFLPSSETNGCCFRKGSLQGAPNCSLHLSPSLLLDSVLCEVSSLVGIL